MKNLIHLITAIFFLPSAVIFGSVQAGDSPGRWMTVVTEHEDLFTGLAIVILLLAIRSIRQAPGDGGLDKMAHQKNGSRLSVSHINRRRFGKNVMVREKHLKPEKR